MKKENNNFNRKLIIVFCAAAVLVPFCYILYTGHIWEDFFITFKFSRNLAEGNGLVYQPGVRVHGFTSPLGVLLPALCYLLSPDKTYAGAIWIFRIFFCIPAFVLGGYFVIKTFLDYDATKEKSSIINVATIFAALFYLVETKSVIFSVNGMETAFMLIFLAWSFYLLQSGIEKKWLLTGIAWGGLMWSRPDSCVYVAGLMLTTLVFAKNRKTSIIGIIKAALVTTAVYLPWFIWAWTYYGTPVPHTVTAKGSQLFSGGIISFLTRWYEHTSWVFAPVYPHFGGWPTIVAMFASALSIFCFFYWMIPEKKESKDANPSNNHLGKIAKTGSFLFFILSFYLGFMTFPYPWYFPPVAMIGIIVIVAGTFHLFNRIKDPVRQFRYSLFVNSVILLLFIFILIMTSFQMRIQQNLIENNTRTALGKWLKKNIKQNDRIFLECLGYIGYFSEGKMLDYPGLCTPEVAKLLKEKKLNRANIIPVLKPEWLVLRPAEVQEIYKMPFFKRDYELVKEFNSQNELKKFKYIPGKNYLIYDSYFYVIKRKAKR